MLKRLAAQALAVPPLWPLLRQRALRGNPLTILCYHTLGPDCGGPDAWTVLRVNDFRRQVALLRMHYDIVSLDEALDSSMSSGRPRVVLTLDDGETGLHRYLLPLVRCESLPVLVYVATGHLAAGRPYWFDRVMNACQTDQPYLLDLRDQGLGCWQLPGYNGVGRWQVLGPLLEAMKLVEPARREVITECIEAALPAPPSERRLAPLTMQQLKELSACPWVTIGSHSDCHNLLDQIPLTEARDSIRRSRELLREWTGHEVVHFAYPNGNHSPALASTVKELGFRSATILGMRLANREDDPLALPRLSVSRYESLARFKLRLVGM